jgi:hypothetical protein
MHRRRLPSQPPLFLIPSLKPYPNLHAPANPVLPGLPLARTQLLLPVALKQQTHIPSSGIDVESGVRSEVKGGEGTEGMGRTPEGEDAGDGAAEGEEGWWRWGDIGLLAEVAGG